MFRGSAGMLPKAERSDFALLLFDRFIPTRLPGRRKCNYFRKSPEEDMFE